MADFADCTDGPPDWQVTYDDFVARIDPLGLGRSAPKAGDRFPPIALPDSHGRFHDLATLAQSAQLVVSFNRGGWCPYCRGELESWRQAMSALDDVGGRLIVVTGEVGGRAESLAEILDGKAVVLCDVDHGLALALGLAFFAGTDLLRRYHECGLDLTTIYGTSSGILPIPATFVLDRESVVRFAFVEPDFRLRAQPFDVIDIISRLPR